MDDLPSARKAKYEYRRNLPHIQAPGRIHFVTFKTWHKMILSPRARDLVLEHCLHDHGRKLTMHACVVMPDHVHLVLSPNRDREGADYGFAELIGSIKGASAHSVNRLMMRRGHVWQDESFDHVVRSGDAGPDPVEYVRQNPVRKGLVIRPEDYRWLWVEW